VDSASKYVISINTAIINEGMIDIKTITIDLACDAHFWATIQTESMPTATGNQTINNIQCLSKESCVEHVNACLVIRGPALTKAQRIVRRIIIRPVFRRLKAKMLMDLDEVCDRLSICLR
jgi:hypothetical protein